MYCTQKKIITKAAGVALQSRLYNPLPENPFTVLLAHIRFTADFAAVKTSLEIIYGHYK